MNKIINYIFKEKEWIFSGIGNYFIESIVSLTIFIIGFFYLKKSKKKKVNIKKNSDNLKNAKIGRNASIKIGDDITTNNVVVGDKNSINNSNLGIKK